VVRGGTDLYSRGGAYKLAMQTDGNLVYYYGQVIVKWHSNTMGNPGAYMSMQTDGNLVVYSAAGAPLWWSGTCCRSGAYLAVQQDGNLVIYAAGGAPIWYTGTYSNMTPSLGGGDCWRQSIGVPKTCRTSWRGRGWAMNFRLFDDFDPVCQCYYWYYNADIGRDVWNRVPGPQWVYWNSSPAESWIRLKYSWEGDHHNTDRTGAVTWNCNEVGACTDLSQPMNIQWSDIYLNATVLNANNNFTFQNTVAHEIGHAMGLYHNPSDTNSAMWAVVDRTRLVLPPLSDYGGDGDCGIAPSGIRCIYGTY
jgi:hypothetical protein